jgi:hypothetical protein
MDEIVGADPETPGVFGTRFLKTESDHLPRQALGTRLKGREQKAFPHAGNITTELKAKARPKLTGSTLAEGGRQTPARQNPQLHARSLGKQVRSTNERPET